MSKKKKHKHALSVLGDKILARPFKVETMAGDIHLPDRCQETPIKSIVLEVGPLGHPDLKEGDIIIASRTRGTDIERGGEKFRIYDPVDVLGIVK